MSALTFQRRQTRACVGLKGPRAAEWLSAPGMVLPLEPNTWTESSNPGAADAALLVAKLGAGEFFLEDRAVAARASAPGASAPGAPAAGAAVRRIAAALQTPPPGVYPILREDAAFLLSGDGALDVLAQICNVDFAALELDRRPLILTLMIGVAVLVVPQRLGTELQYRIWCDPTYGSYYEESVGRVVVDCSGRHAEVSA